MQITSVIASSLLVCLLLNVHKTKGSYQWPSGSYGLPHPLSGCPQYWKEGYRYQDTEDEFNNNRHSKQYHLSGIVNKHGIRQEFCMKDESLFEEVDMPWPDGEYCIYKYKQDCPDGFKEGWIFWDDENIEEIDGGNSVVGHTPDGVYEKDTLIYFCCNEKGNASTPIILPLTTPFYLFPYKTSRCQQVIGTRATSEYIHWDDEDRGNRNAHSKNIPYGVTLDAWDTILYYCYYDVGICGKHGTMCKNVSIDENKLEGKSTIMNSDDRRKKGWSDHSRKHESTSSLTAILVGCSVAGVIVGTALAGIGIRSVLDKRLMDIKDPDNFDESLPLPDHEWEQFPEGKRNKTVKAEIKV